MTQSICKFVPVKDESGDIKALTFVYETELHSLKQPFFKPIWHIHLVTSGSGKLRIYDKEYPLSPGCIFFAFPGSPYFIEAEDNFHYLYIGFMGSGVSKLFDDLSIRITDPVYPGFDHITEFWLAAINRVNRRNANILVESVLLYTLSFLHETPDAQTPASGSEQTFRLIADYVDTHFRDPDISLKKIAGLFSYTEKYLSSLFKKHMQTGFRDYVNCLRIQYAQQLLIRSSQTATQIAAQCGFRDSLYFSKVFKKRAGLTPNEFQLQRAAEHKGDDPL